MDRRRIRFEHLIPAGNLEQETSDTTRAFRLSGAPAGASPQLVAPSMTVAKRPRDMALRDWAIYLLHNAALIEHALMVQYLYALYSLDDSASGPDASDASTTAAVSSWIPKIRKIAVEEMGHLLTVQNILRFVGGSITFEREDFPIPTEVYPFRFQLERLTKDVLAKYVYAEMPEGDIDSKFISAAEKADIEQRAKKSADVEDGNFANHVGTLYTTLLNVFADPAFQSPATSGFPPATDTQAVTFQATAGVSWPRVRGNNSIVDTVDSNGDTHPVKLDGARVLSVNSRDDVLAALSFIARQGEASDKGSMRLSHFGRFLDIYRSFPDEGAAGWSNPPAFRVPTNPTTVSTPDTPSTISHKATQLWARLFDVRYRILLMSLAHATAIPTVTNASDTTPTAETEALVSWIFQVMLEQKLSVAGLARLLPRMPRTNPPTADMAGAPFTMPYSTTIPNRSREQWQLHLDMLDSSKALVVEIKKTAPDPLFPAFIEANAGLDELLEADASWREQVGSFLESL